MLNGQKKRTKKLSKIQSFKFYYPFNNFGRDSPQEYINLEEQIWCVLSEEMSFKTFTPIWSYVNEKKWQKSKIWNFGIDPP